MAGAKIVVLYPRPTDAGAFERAYLDEHVPLLFLIADETTMQLSRSGA